MGKKSNLHFHSPQAAEGLQPTRAQVPTCRRGRGVAGGKDDPRVLGRDVKMTNADSRQRQGIQAQPHRDPGRGS